MTLPLSSPMIEQFKLQLAELKNSISNLTVINETQALTRYENDISLNELNTCFTDSSPEQLHDKLVVFLANRWERIRKSSCGYTQLPHNALNQFCLKIAQTLAPLPSDKEDYDQLEENEGPYFLLMPTLKVNQTVYGDNIHHLQLHEFVLSDNDDLFIPVELCLVRGFESDHGQLTHLTSVDGQYPALTPSEFARVTDHSPEVANYYQLISNYNKLRLYDSNFGTELVKLHNSLLIGGAAQGGAEYNAGSAANEGISAFAQYWDKVSDEEKNKLYKKYERLKTLLGRLMRPNDVSYRNATYCVELIAQEFEYIIDHFNNNHVNMTHLKQQVLLGQKALHHAFQTNPYIPTLAIERVRQPKVFTSLFKLPAQARQRIFPDSIKENALYISLMLAPEAYPDYVGDLTAAEIQQATSLSFENKETALIIAAKNGALKSVELLLDGGAAIDALTSDGMTALSWAAAKGHHAVVALLFAHGANKEVVDRSGNSAVNLAILNKQVKVLAILLEHGADLDVRNQQNENAFGLALTLLPDSSLLDQIVLAGITLDTAKQQQIMYNGFKVGSQFNQFNFLLFAASQRPQLFGQLLEITQLKGDFKILRSQDRYLRSPLIWAASLGNLAAVKKILDLNAKQQLAIDVDKADYEQNTALHYAAKNGHTAVVDLLVDNGANVHKTNNQKDTPLHLAIQNKNLRVVEVLIKRNVDLRVRNAKRRNALDLAIQYHPMVLEPLLEKLITYSLEDQKEMLSGQNGHFDNLLIFVACKQPSLLKSLLAITHKTQDYANAKVELKNFFNIDTHIDRFTAKLKEVEIKAEENSAYELAVLTLRDFIDELQLARARFLLSDDKPLEVRKAELKDSCLHAANEAKPVLTTHRELLKFIGAFLLILITLPVSLPVCAIGYGMGFFTAKTKSAQALDVFKEDIEKLDSKPDVN